MGGIDIDPGSTPEANACIKSTTFYSSDDNGLERPWAGRVWMNPPYATPLVGLFCQRLVEHLHRGEVTDALVLVNNATETGWFRTLADVASARCDPEGRVRFWHPQKDAATPLQGQTVLYFGIDLARFQAEFEPFGVVWVKP